MTKPSNPDLPAGNPEFKGPITFEGRTVQGVPIGTSGYAWGSTEESERHRLYANIAGTSALIATGTAAVVSAPLVSGVLLIGAGIGAVAATYNLIQTKKDESVVRLVPPAPREESPG